MRFFSGLLSIFPWVALSPAEVTLPVLPTSLPLCAQRGGVAHALPLATSPILPRPRKKDGGTRPNVQEEPSLNLSLWVLEGGESQH